MIHYQYLRCFMKNEYITRINQAIDYIYRNLDKNLSVEEIANHCCFSKYYFNRIFKSVINESLYAFVKRLKLEYAAFKLRTTQRQVTEVALEAGYSPSNFATAFKEYFGINATEYRKLENFPVKDSYLSIIENIKSMRRQPDFFKMIDSKITIRRIKGMNLEYQRYIGNYYKGLPQAWEKFCIEMEKKYPLIPNKQFIGISYDDPMIADDQKCIYDLCLKVEKTNGINTFRIEDGYYACYEFHDKIENLIKCYNEIFALWLPFTKYDLDNRLCLEIYYSGLDDQGFIHLDACIPIRI